MANGYVAPVKGQVKRLDQGIDYQGNPGDPVVAIGLARVDYVKDDPGGFGKVVYYTLLDGPAKGKQVYVGHAAPVVHAGQHVQAGQPVATLQQVSGGNASNLPGWTEVGFAKNGVPESGAAGDTASAKRFQKLLSGASAPASPSTAAPAAAQTPLAGNVTPQLPQPGTQAQTDTQPDALSTQPFEPPPGSGINSASNFVADMWNRIASQPGASVDTQLLAQNAQLVGG